MVSFGAMNAQKLKEVLELHMKWRLGEEDGIRADLSWVSLIGADLSGANLRGARLNGISLNFANLSGVSLIGADLSGADLRDTNLNGANLNGANLSGAILPAPTMVLLASWGGVSDELCSDLMNYDASCHDDPKAFERWAVKGDCPYRGVRYQRAARFMEDCRLWDPKRPLCRPFDLMVRCIREKCTDSDYHDLPGAV